MNLTIKILVILILTSCSQKNNSIDTKTQINIDSVKSIHIKKDLSDTTSTHLTQKQTELFVKEWNTAKPTGVYKIFSEFWITVKLKNNSIRKFRANENLIQENDNLTYVISDTALMNSFEILSPPAPFSFPTSNDYDPISFIEEASNIPTTKEGIYPVSTIVMGEKLPIGWVREEYIESLLLLLDSKDTCRCFFNIYASYFPKPKFAQKGGYAGIFIKSFIENKEAKLGLYSCPEVDEKRNEEIRKWWRERKSTIQK